MKFARPTLSHFASVVAICSGVLAVGTILPSQASEIESIASPSLVDPEILNGGQPNSNIVTIDLPHSVRLEDAESLVNDLDIAVAGFRSEQPGIEGEFYPSDDYTSTDHLNAFKEYTGTQPAVVGVLLATAEHPLSRSQDRMEGESSNASDLFAETRDELIEASRSLPLFEPASASPPDNSFAGGARERLEQAVPQAEVFSNSTPHPRAGFPPPPEAWAPYLSEIAAVENLGDEAVVLMTSSWTGDFFVGSRPSAMPTDWGIELEVSLYNDDLGLSHPFCLPTDLDEFWGVHDVNSWTLLVPNDPFGGNYGSYLDSQDASDPCSRNALAIGIGYPQNLPMSNVGRTIQTMIITDRGAVAESEMGAYYQAVSNDCNDLGLAPNTNCMDLNGSRTFPGPGGKNLTIVNPTREWTVPNCIYTNQVADPRVEQRPNLVSNGCWLD